MGDGILHGRHGSHLLLMFLFLYTPVLHFGSVVKSLAGSNQSNTFCLCNERMVLIIWLLLSLTNFPIFDYTCLVMKRSVQVLQCCSLAARNEVQTGFCLPPLGVFDML